MSAVGTTQMTLGGEEVIDEDVVPRARPETFLYCWETDEWVLRTRQYDFPHKLYTSPKERDRIESMDTGPLRVNSGHDWEDDENEPREVGGEYDVRLSFSVTYSKTVVASSKDQAEDRARDLLSFSEDAPASADSVHEDVSKVETITEDDDRADDIPGWPW